MEEHAFVGLQHLNILFLTQNHLCQKNNSYAQDVFKNVSNQLKFLDISGNLMHIPENLLSYPAEALSVLSSLKTLRLDCISGLKLDNELGNLTNLKKLDFSGGIQADYLSDDMFFAISSLDIKTVNFSNVNVKQASEKVFSTLKSLRVLDFTNNPQARDSLIKISSTLGETSIEELYLENTCIGIHDANNEILDNLGDTKIKVLSLDRNDIHNLKSICASLPHIENLTVTHNGLSDFIAWFKDCSLTTNLTKVDISYQNLLHESACKRSNTNQVNNIPHLNRKINFNFCLYGNICTVIWPSKLEWLAFSQVGIHISKIPKSAFLNNGTLKYVDVSGNNFETLPKPVYCREKPHVISTVEYFDASNCGIKCITKDMFEHCNFSFRFANLSHNKLGSFEGGCNKNPMDILLSVRPLTTLAILDISFNSISILLNNTFDTLINLQVLNLSNNELSVWKPNITHLINLELLDLSYNNFQTLSEDTRLMLYELDEHHWQKTTMHFSLNLLGNTFLCSCGNIQFLKWLATSEIHFVGLKHYTCEFMDRKQVQLSDNLNQIIIELESMCTSNIWLICSLTILTTHFAFVTMSTVLYRNRHFFKYLILKMRMRRERLDAVLGNNNEYLFDAFVSCTREGAKWAKKYLLPKLENQDTGLKFCVAQRDFLVGKTIIDNIMDTISQSRKTILLVDETFINSKWCQEELLLSHHVSVDTFHL